ncbi:CHAT domain protein [Ceratobasidium sp. AG-Ba]|nr:CHAT domain protein [Ceratobasidium sp. AG-Ba]
MLSSHRGSLIDIDKAIECHSQAVSLTPKEHGDQPSQLTNLGNSHCRRFERLGELVDIDLAIDYQSQALSLMPEGHAGRVPLLHNLGTSYVTRFQLLGDLAEIDRAIDYLSQALPLMPDEHTGKPLILNSLGSAFTSRFDHQSELSDICKAIDYQTRAITIAPQGHAGRPRHLHSLGVSHDKRSNHLKNLEDIELAIKRKNEAVSLAPDGHAEKVVFWTGLAISYSIRFDRKGERNDILASMASLKTAVECSTGHPLTRFNASRAWAQLALAHGTSPLEPYSQAMKLINKVVWLGVAVEHRFKNITNNIQNVALEAAAVAISMEAYDFALEWLEQGRSIVWSQITRLRSPFDEVSSFDAALADNLKQVANELDRLASPASLELTPPHGVPSLNFAAHHHHRLAERWESLLSRALDIPGLSRFLQPKQVRDLAPAAERSTLVVINLHKDHCSALSLLPGSKEVICTPLPLFSYDKAVKLQTELSDSLQSAKVRTREQRRPLFRRESMTENNFKAILADLWGNVVRPVLTSLGYLTRDSNAKLPRITWCTTGPLAFLPLHAAGCYDKPRSVIFDYVPGNFSGILAVGQEFTNDCSALPGTVPELNEIERQASRVPFTRLDGKSATSMAVLAGMERHSWVHLACHASQNVADPMASAFHLQDRPLDMATIARKSLKNASFAFLSACQTATGDEKLPDEAVHLAAGLITAGYSSVIATMWSIEDEDAPLVAKGVYARMLEGGTVPNKDAESHFSDFPKRRIRSVPKTVYLIVRVKWFPDA